MNVPAVKGKPKREDAPGPTHEEMRAFVCDAVSEVLAAVRSEMQSSIDARLAQALNREKVVLARPEELAPSLAVDGGAGPAARVTHVDPQVVGVTSGNAPARLDRLEHLVNQMAKIHTEQWGHALVEVAPSATVEPTGEPHD